MGSNSLAQSLGGLSPEQWATDFLSLIGAPVTSTNVGTIVKWEYAESGGGGGNFNPLNTTQGGYGGSSINGAGVKDYPDYLSGLRATAQAFNGGLSKFGYGAILSGLKAQDQAATFSAIDSSSWGTHDLPSGSEAGPTFTAATSSPTQDLAALLKQGVPIQQAIDQASAQAKAAGFTADNDCLWKLPSVSAGPLSVGGQCLIHRSQGRALLGAVSVAAGVALVLIGLGFVFAATKAGGKILQTVGPVAGAAALA